MKINDFEILICSPCEYEKLTCEICYKNEIFAEISQETAELTIDIYPLQKNECWKIPLVQLQELLESAKNHLVGNKKSEQLKT